MKTFCNLIWLLAIAVGWSTHAAAPSATPLGALAQQLHGPAGVAADAAGNIYVTDPAAGSVVVFDAFGQQCAVREGFAGPLAIAIAGDGRIYLSEQQSGSVSVFDSQWNLLYQLGAGTNEFQFPAHLAVDPLAPGTVYVSDGPANLVRVFTGAALVGQFGGAGTNDGQFYSPKGLSVLVNGEVLVVNQDALGNNRVEAFTNGVFTRRFSLPAGRPQALFVDGIGRAFVTDTLEGNVNVFDAGNGSLLGTVGSFGSAAGQLNLPLGVVMDAYNRLCVVSANNSRVELFGVDKYFHLTTPVVNGALAVGNALTFSVTAGGAGPLSYQWLKNGVIVAGATNATLLIANAVAGDSGSYSVIITDSSGSVTSSVTPVVVQSAPNILSGPQSQSVLAGADVNFSVVALGSGLRVQWQFNGQNLDGETNTSLSLPAVQAAQSGQYSVVVANAVGSVSRSASLTVTVPPVVMDIVSSGKPADSLFGLTVNLDPGFSYVLEASTDLVQWETVTTFSAAGGLYDFADENSTSLPSRFYRLRWEH